MGSVMIVDDSPLNRNRIKQVLEEKLQDITIREEDEGTSTLSNLILFNIDVCILNISISDGKGLELLKKIKGDSMLTDISVIICGESKDEELIARSFQLGATDFLLRTFDDREINVLLPLKVSRALEISKCAKKHPRVNRSNEQMSFFHIGISEEKERQGKTDEVFLNELVQKNERLQALNNFKDKLYMIFVHDIKSSAAALVSLTELLEEDYEKFAEDNKEIFLEVKKQVNNTFEIIENLLDWLNRQRSGLVFRPMQWNLANILLDTIALYNESLRTKKITIDFKIDEDMRVFADRDMLILIFRNLISNAIKFTGLGGMITIGAVKEAEEIILEVKDNGIGMEEKKLQRLFDIEGSNSTVGTLGEKGIGLGMLICRELVKKWDGRIWVESELGIGSSFYFTLPACED